MRKSAVFVLLVCMAFHHFGFYVVQFIIPELINQNWENKIWEDNTEQHEQLIRVPFSMPYGQNQENFQPANFSLLINGKLNRVIKQRYFDDHLEVIVVYDHLQSHFEKQLNLWISSIGSDQGEFEGTPMQKLLLKSFVKDFIPQKLASFLLRKPIAACEQNFSIFLLRIPIGVKSIYSPPPW